MGQEFIEKFKDVIDFVENSDLSSPNKPAKPHVKRVGEFLYKKGFDNEVVVAGLLHDMLEWSSITEKELTEKFGERVLEIINANSKNRSILDIDTCRRDTVRRCLLVGDEAMAVKIADVLDSIAYYTGTKNEKELERFLIHAKLLKENLSENLEGVFLGDLEKNLT